MLNQVMRVKRGAIAACMTCPICEKLLRDATTISECLHTFCRRCIYKKLSDEEVDCCPVCNIDLGCAPLEKLRPDHTLQDVRDKIFPSKRRKISPPDDVEVVEVVSSVALPAKIKERSLSSLVVNTPRVSTTAPTGRRSKFSARKTSRGSSFSVEKQIRKEDDFKEELESSSSRETLTARQNPSFVEQSSDAKPDIERENGADPWEGKVDSWKPLDCLAEVANRSKSSKFTSQGSASKSEPINGPKTERPSREAKQRPRAYDEKDSIAMDPPESVNPKKLRRLRAKKAATFGESGISPQTVLDAASNRRERKLDQIWCSLVASEEQEGYRPLPQISSSFLRIKDGSAPISSVQKYLMKKLDLPTADEVEIRCMGQPVMPTLQLHTLVELWLQTVSATSERVSATIGASATEFVMVLGYAHKAPSS